MDIRLNIYDENNRWVGVDYLTEKGKWMHKWVHKGELERGSWRGRAVGENDINWRYESALDKPSEREQANDNIPFVSQRSELLAFIAEVDKKRKEYPIAHDEQIVDMILKANCG